MNKLQIDKKNVVVVSIIFVISLITCAPLIQMHMAPDTYQVIDLGYKEYAKQYFMRSARIITAATFLISDYIDLNYSTYIIIMEIISVICLSLSVYFLYSFLLKKLDIKNNIQKLLVLLSTYVLIYNVFTLEFLLYAESGIICFSILLCVLAAICFSKESKYRYLKTLLITMFATICYQGTINLFFILSLLLIAVNNKEKIFSKKVIKDIILAGTILVISFILTVLLIYVCTNMLGLTQERFSSDFDRINIANIIISFINISYYTLTIGFGFIPTGLLFLIICFTCIVLSIETKFKNLVYYLFIVFASLVVCIIPIYTMETPSISARMCMSIGAIIGISYVFIILFKKQTKPIIEYIFLGIVVITCIYTCITYSNTFSKHIAQNKIDDLVGQSIAYRIQKYEEETGYEITKVAITNDTNRTFYTFNETKNTYTERALANYYCILEVLNYYSNKKLICVPISEEIYIKHYYGKDWNCYSDEQIVFAQDTMYYCMY